MHKTSNTDKKPNDADESNDQSFRTALLWIIIAGIVLLGVLIGVSIQHPYLTERIKFATANVLNVLLFMAIIFQTIIYLRQWKAMRQQHEAMKRQLDLMQTQADAMQESLIETRNIVSQNERIVKAMEIQSDASQTSARTAQETVAATKEAFYITERPYVSIKGIKHIRIVAEACPQMDFWIYNGGRTPAWNITIHANMEYSSELVKEFRRDTTPVVDERPFMLPAGRKQIIRLRDWDFIITQGMLDAIHSKKMKLMLIGEIHYKDFWEQGQVYPFRGVYNPDENTLSYY